MAAHQAFAPNTALDAILTCQLCLCPLENPFTLPQCLHSFCKGCLDDLPETSVNHTMGLECQLCKKFSAVNEIKHDDFVEKLLVLHKGAGEKEDHNTCKQCLGRKDVKWKCNDCKIELCGICRASHTNIPVAKHHKVSLLSDDVNNNIVDEVVFCKMHPDRVVELNCSTCNQVVCVLCKVLEDHETHSFETVDDALKRTLPEMKQSAVTVTANLEHLENKINSVRRKIEDTKVCYAEIKKQLNGKYEHILTVLESIKAEEESLLGEKEKRALGLLGDVKIQLETQLEGSKHLVKLYTVTTESARHTSLLGQLQDGLAEKIQLCSKFKSQLMTLTIPIPNCTFSPDKIDYNTKLRHILGTMREKNVQCRISPDGFILDKRYLCDDAFDYFEQSFVRTVEIRLSKDCYHISCINSQIWVTVPDQIQIFDLSGQLIKRLELPFDPFVVRQFHNNEILVSSSSGLYHLNMVEACKSVKLVDGLVCDFDTYGSSIHVLDHDNSQIVNIRLSKLPQTQSVATRKEVAQTIPLPRQHSYDTICRTESGFLLTSGHGNNVFAFDIFGCPVRDHINPSSLRLCGIDRKDCVIAANVTRDAICLLNQQVLSDHKQVKLEKSDHKQVKLEKSGSPRSIAVDIYGNLWVLEQLDGNFKLVKYIIQDSSVDKKRKLQKK